MWLSFSHLSFAPAPFHIPLLSENWDRTPTDFPMFGALREHWYIFLPLTIACVIVYPYNIYKLIKNKP